MQKVLRLPSTAIADRVPATLWLAISALFHYLGPAFAVLLFPHIGVLGIAWFRIASAAVFFALWRRPWQVFFDASPRERALIIAFGASLAAMNTFFYLAIDRLPLGTVATLEFFGVLAVAAYGLQSRRNFGALALAMLGVWALTDGFHIADQLGMLFAFLNALLFVVYIVLGHRLAASGASDGVSRLGTGMAVAFLFVFPLGIGEASAAFAEPLLVAAGIGVGLCSSVIPYICDQLVMARLPRSTFALMLTLLPACAVIIGALVLAQIPSRLELLGVVLVMAGIAVHQPGPPAKET